MFLRSPSIFSLLMLHPIFINFSASSQSCEIVHTTHLDNDDDCQLTSESDSEHTKDSDELTDVEIEQTQEDYEANAE